MTLDEGLLAHLKRRDPAAHRALTSTLKVLGPLVLAVVVLMIARDALIAWAHPQPGVHTLAVTGFLWYELGRLLIACLAARCWTLSLKKHD